MVCSTKGIVLKTFKYGETSLIAKIFTRELGMQSYIVNGIRKSSGKKKASLFIPMTLLDMEVYHKETQSLKRIKELRNYNIYREIPFDIIKSSISIYISEILYKSIKSDQPQPGLYDALESRLIYLDNSDTDLTLFPIHFLISLSEQLGFGPLNNRMSENDVFDLMEGRFSGEIPDHMHYLEKETSTSFCRILEEQFTHLTPQNIPKDHRNTILSGLQDYFRLHIDNFGEMKALKILQEVLS